MRKVFIIVTLICLNSLNAVAQGWTFEREGIEYVIELPSATWRVVSRVDLHEHVDFVNGKNEANGYLRPTKILVDVDTTAANLFQKDEKWNLQHLPGYVLCSDCSGEAFRGHLSGATFSYEYTSRGRTVSGRVYYLQIDKRTFYALRFTVDQDKLRGLREQMDFIARSFRLK
ncbi:MAG TPA: hypothetical protein VLA93_13445 [Pyrinomonadaceae bacterium]|nr:hypothetical protein [Pyrinomonadaceae bacterium]